jgi:hypothetical protein
VSHQLIGDIPRPSSPHVVHPKCVMLPAIMHALLQSVLLVFMHCNFTASLLHYSTTLTPFFNYSSIQYEKYGLALAPGMLCDIVAMHAGEGEGEEV